MWEHKLTVWCEGIHICRVLGGQFAVVQGQGSRTLAEELLAAPGGVYCRCCRRQMIAALRRRLLQDGLWGGRGAEEAQGSHLLARRRHGHVTVAGMVLAAQMMLLAGG